MNNYRYQNLPERIERLRKHLKTRRGRRDFVALGTLVDIGECLKRVNSRTLTSISFGALLKERYIDEPIGPHPLLSMISRDDCPPDRIYIIPTKFEDK